jgi:thiol-disulfide isomerase/thioredoxin
VPDAALSHHTVLPPSKGPRAARLATTLLLALMVAGCNPGPDYQLSDGSTGNYADWRGQWVVINYWAAWCKPCLEEMPELAAFARDQAGQVLVFGVNFDNPEPAALTEQIQALKVAIAVPLTDIGAHLGLPRPSALPTTYILDPRGALAATLRGPQDAATLSAAIAAARQAPDV